MIKLWADTHFNHEGIIRYSSRPYSDFLEMNAGLVGRWNSAVSETDEVWFLGDFGFSTRTGTDLAAVFSVLNGRKHLVVGNHDEKNPRVGKLPWVSKHDLVTLREGGARAVACHYPLETWKGAHRGYLMVHGHSHGSLKRVLPHRFDVGCDVEVFPVSLQELAARAAAQVFQPVDHHGEA